MPRRDAVDYDRLSATYDSRYAENQLDGIGEALRNLVTSLPARKVAEIGCGTGHWLGTLAEAGAAVFGVDASSGMLARAAARSKGAGLIAARANQLPFHGATFDLICCVKALHHFDDPSGFIREAASLLLPGGTVAIVGIDPRTIRHRYHYDYFDDAKQLDLRRYPSFGQIVDWMVAAGLENVEHRVVATSRRHFRGKEVLNDAFLAKASDSTMALLTQQAYDKGLRRISADLERASTAKQPLLFRSEMTFCMTSGNRAS